MCKKGEPLPIGEEQRGTSEAWAGPRPRHRKPLSEAAPQRRRVLVNY